MYTLSHTKDIQGPLPSVVTIDPYDPKKGQKQTVTIALSHTSPITAAFIHVASDHMTKTYSLHQISGTSQNGEWQTVITIEDTHDYIYSFGLDFQSATSNFKKAMMFRIGL